MLFVLLNPIVNLVRIFVVFFLLGEMVIKMNDIAIVFFKSAFQTIRKSRAKETRRRRAKRPEEGRDQKKRKSQARKRGRSRQEEEQEEGQRERASEKDE